MPGSSLEFGVFAAIGLPGFANFAGKIMIFFGAFRNGWVIGRFHIFQIATVLALWGVVLSTVYMLRAYRKTFMGSIGEQWQAVLTPAHPYACLSRCSWQHFFALDFFRFLVYGIAWIFGATGQTNLYRLTAALANAGGNSRAALLGMVLVLVALGFKIAAVPFQIWVPDVYQGAPTPVTAYLSVGSKAAGFVVLIRVLQPFMNLPQTQRLIFVIALLTLIYGNLAALPQTNLKRLLAYSSIAHAGYLLIGVVCFDVRAITFYLVAYLLMTLLSFAVLIIVAQRTGEDISDFDGLARRSPFLAFAMLIGMVSLAGVPFTAGFLGKFYIFYAAVLQRQIALIVVGVITVGCGFYYYLKVVRAMYWQSDSKNDAIPVNALSRVAISALIVATIWRSVERRPAVQAVAGVDDPGYIQFFSAGVYVVPHHRPLPIITSTKVC